MYSSYKKLRNFVSDMNEKESLEVIWHLSTKHCNKILLREIHPWEVEILSREIILNAGVKNKRKLKDVSSLYKCVNYIRELSDYQVRNNLEDVSVLLNSVQRSVRQQFIDNGDFVRTAYRCFKVYSYPKLKEKMLEGKSLSIFEIFYIGVMLHNYFNNKSYCLDISASRISFDGIIIAKEKIHNFLEIMAIDFEELKARTREKQEYNENWSYTINPLRATPFIWKDSGKEKVLCPIPRLILKKITEGIYFDFINGKYPNEYGEAFEKYLHEITNAVVCQSSIELKLKTPSPYHVKKDRKDGADLIFYDKDAAMIIESKCKRLCLPAQYKLGTESIYSELGNLAKYVVQNYKNIIDISNNITGWDPDGKMLFSVIITLVDWSLFTPDPYDHLEKSVDDILHRQGISSEIKSMYPYIVMSANEYEISIKIIEKIGVKIFFEKILKVKSDTKGWFFINILEKTFPKELEEWKNDHKSNLYAPMMATIEQEIKEHFG